ncbi:MAG: hypothetical protein ACYTXA_16370 [Nostoc sp.]
MPNTSLREAAPTASRRDATRTLLLYERLRQRRRSVQVSTSAQCPTLIELVPKLNQT